MTPPESLPGYDIPPEKDDELRVLVEAKFRQLSVENPQDLHPIESFSVDELGWMRRRLIEAGFKIEVISQEGKEALKQSMFRAKVALDKHDFDCFVNIKERKVVDVLVFDHKRPEGYNGWVRLDAFKPEVFRDFIDRGNPSEGDRSLGVYELMGPEKLKDLVKESYEIAMGSGYPRMIGKHSGTEGRAVQQTAIDILQASVECSQEAGINLARRLNHRILKGGKYRWQDNEDNLQILDHNFEEVGEPHEKLRSLQGKSLLEIWEFLT